MRVPILSDLQRLVGWHCCYFDRFVVLFGLILIISSLCGYVQWLAAASSSLIVVSRMVFSGFLGSLGVMFWSHGVTWGVIFKDFWGDNWGCISDRVLGLMLMRF